jgi:hypothetical protein
MEANPRISRRTALKGIGAAGLVAGLPALTASGARAAGASIDWAAFDAAAARQFHAMSGVGAAYAVVSADKVLHAHTLGVRDLTSRRPVDAGTHFMVASTTKSMTSLLTATFVDDKKLHWDQKVKGGFNWSSQRLSERGCDGQAGWVDEGVDGQSPDEVTRGAVVATRGGEAVLA